MHVQSPEELLVRCGGFVLGMPSLRVPGLHPENLRGAFVLGIPSLRVPGMHPENLHPGVCNIFWDAGVWHR